MASKVWEDTLIRLLLHTLNSEKEIEKLRKHFCSTVNNPKQVFDLLDKNNKGYLNYTDLLQLIDKNNNISTQINNQELAYYLRQVINLYDRKDKFHIDYKEFLNLTTDGTNFSKFSKCDTKGKDGINNNNEDTQRTHLFSEKITLESLTEIIFLEIAYLKGFYYLVQKLKDNKDFSAYEAFMMLDCERKKFIDMKSLNWYFNMRHKFSLTEKQLTMLLFRLDTDKDGVVSYKEFQEHFYYSSNIHLLQNSQYNNNYYSNDKNDNNEIRFDNYNGEVNVNNNYIGNDNFERELQCKYMNGEKNVNRSDRGENVSPITINEKSYDNNYNYNYSYNNDYNHKENSNKNNDFTVREDYQKDCGDKDDRENRELDNNIDEKDNNNNNNNISNSNYYPPIESSERYNYNPPYLQNNQNNSNINNSNIINNEDDNVYASTFGLDSAGMLNKIINGTNFESYNNNNQNKNKIEKDNYRDQEKRQAYNTQNIKHQDDQNKENDENEINNNIFNNNNKSTIPSLSTINKINYLENFNKSNNYEVNSNEYQNKRDSAQNNEKHIKINQSSKTNLNFDYSSKTNPENERERINSNNNTYINSHNDNINCNNRKPSSKNENKTLSLNDNKVIPNTDFKNNNNIQLNTDIKSKSLIAINNKDNNSKDNINDLNNQIPYYLTDINNIKETETNKLFRNLSPIREEAFYFKAKKEANNLENKIKHTYFTKEELNKEEIKKYIQEELNNQLHNKIYSAKAEINENENSNNNFRNDYNAKNNDNNDLLYYCIRTSPEIIKNESNDNNYTNDNAFVDDTDNVECKDRSCDDNIDNLLMKTKPEEFFYTEEQLKEELPQKEVKRSIDITNENNDNRKRKNVTSQSQSNIIKDNNQCAFNECNSIKQAPTINDEPITERVDNSFYKSLHNNRINANNNVNKTIINKSDQTNKNISQNIKNTITNKLQHRHIYSNYDYKYDNRDKIEKDEDDIEFFNDTNENNNNNNVDSDFERNKTETYYRKNDIIRKSNKYNNNDIKQTINKIKNYLSINKLNKREISDLLLELEYYKSNITSNTNDKLNKTVYKNKNKIKTDLIRKQDINEVLYKDNNNNNNNNDKNDNLFDSFKSKHNLFVYNIEDLDEKAKLIIDFLMKVIQLDSSIEIVKQELLSNQDFNLNLLFEAFDLSGTNHISISDFQEVLFDLELNVSLKDLKLLFKKYDKDLDCKLNKKEFADIFYLIINKNEIKRFSDTKNKNKKTYLHDYSNNNEYNGPISIETKNLLVEFFTLLIKIENELEMLKCNLNRNKLFSAIEAFEIIKSVNNMDQLDLNNFNNRYNSNNENSKKNINRDYNDVYNQGEYYLEASNNKEEVVFIKESINKISKKKVGLLIFKFLLFINYLFAFILIR